MKTQHYEFTYETTYDRDFAVEVEKKLGRPARRFQKSLADGRGDRYSIRRRNGIVDDIVCDFDSSF